MEACACGAWALKLGRRSAPGAAPTWIVYRCKSWRHTGECARKHCQQDFIRFRIALEPHPLERIVFAVLTLDARGKAGGIDKAYEGLKLRWKNLQRSLTRDFGKFEFASTVESHRNGMPHLNVVIVSASIAEFVRENPGTTENQRARKSPRWWSDWAVDAGFGWAATIAIASSKNAVASYVTKFDKGETVTSPTLAGEVTKMSQLPLLAPKRMRRVRSSKGFLPPARIKDPDLTGELWRNPELGKWLERHATKARPVDA